MPGRGAAKDNDQNKGQHRPRREDQESDLTSTDEILPNGTKKKRSRTTAQKNAAKKARQQQQQQNKRDGYPLRSGRGGEGPPPRPPPTSETNTPRAPAAQQGEDVQESQENAGTSSGPLALALTRAPGATSSPSPHGTGSANMAGALARLNEFNPTIALPPKSKKNERTPDDRTFEITYYDGSPLFDDFQYVAQILRTAKIIRDQDLPDENKLKINTRTLKCGDWIVLADDEDTKIWLANYFANSGQFRASYRATLMSERGRQIKYTIRVQPPESKDDATKILDSLFAKVGHFGYVRVVSESRFYNDERIRNAYHKALKKRALNKFSDEGKPYVKTIWLRMSVEASNTLVDLWDELNLYYGINRLEIEMAPDRLQEGPLNPSVNLTNLGRGSSNNNNNNDNNNTADMESEVASIMEEDTENSEANENRNNDEDGSKEKQTGGGEEEEEAPAKDPNNARE